MGGGWAWHGRGVGVVWAWHGRGVGVYCTAHLLLDELVVLAQPRDHGGRDEEARPGEGRPAGDDARMGGHTREEALGGRSRVRSGVG